MKSLHSNRFQLFVFTISLVVVAPFVNPTAAQAKEGGATSGGGHDLGLYAKRIIGIVADAINDSQGIYTTEQKQLIKLRSSQVSKVLISDAELPVANSGHGIGTSIIQQGTAFSSWSPDTQTGQVSLQKDKFNALVDPIAIEVLFAHELAVMAGLETTGDYHLSDAFGTLRSKFWEKRLASQTICTFTVFDKKLRYGLNVPDKIVGTATTGLTSGQTIGGGLALLYHLKKHSRARANDSVIIRYVLGNHGYLRAIVSRAPTTLGIKNDVMLAGPIAANLTPEVVYYTPYDWEVAIRESRLKEYDFGFMMVSCARLD